MKCPKCHQRVAPFKSWILWPGPTRECRSCHANLRYVGLYVQVMLHLVLGVPVVVALGLLVESNRISLWLAAAIFLVILAITAVVLPWNFARYEECDRRTGWTKGLLLPAAILVTAVALFYAWTNWSGARELQSALAQLEQKHESIRFEDFIPPHVSDDQNVAAAPIFRDSFEKKENSRLAQIRRPWEEVGKTKAGEKRLVQIAKKLDPSFSGDEAAAGRVVLNSLNPSAPALDEVREALRRPEVEWPLDYSNPPLMPLDYIGDCVAVARVLHERALAELSLGSSDNAAQDTMTILALAEVMSSPHLLINELVRNSMLTMAFDVIGDGLRRGAWNDADLSALSKSLSQKKLMFQIADGLRGERAYSLQSNLWDLDIKIILNSQPMDAQTQGEWTRRVLELTYKLWPTGWTRRDRAHFIVGIQQQLESLRSGKGISPDEVRRIDLPLSNPSAWDRFTCPLSTLSLTVFGRYVETCAFAQTLLECTRTACAVERYRLANKRLPTNLDELIPSFLPAVPNDPILGKPLLYKPSADGSFTVYGVGWNGIDDGGSIQPSQQTDPHLHEADWGVTTATAVR